METRLSRFCDAIIEAGWLAALVLVPLFFNVYSSRVFEPDKIGVLRSIATIMAGAWLVRVVDVGFSGEPDQPFSERLKAFIHTPLVLPTLLVVLVYFISTRILRDRGAGPTIIISPLLALMRNQIEAARRLGLRAETIWCAPQDLSHQLRESDRYVGRRLSYGSR